MITFRSEPLQDFPRLCFDIVEGLVEPASVRGENPIAPGREGRYVGNRVKDLRKILVEGYVQGQGTTRLARQEDYLSGILDVMAVMDRSLDPGTLEVTGPYLGIPTGQTWTIEARCISVIPDDYEAGYSFRWYSFELESVTPDWDMGS